MFLIGDGENILDKRLSVQYNCLSLLCFMQVNGNAPVAQLDRVSGYEPEGRAFESLRVRHKIYLRPSSSG